MTETNILQLKICGKNITKHQHENIGKLRHY